MVVLRKWMCGECGRLHIDEDDALECCPRSITEVFICPACDEGYSLQEDAENCCGVSSERCPVCSRDHGRSSIDALAVRVAGHCRICSPHYTLDQQSAIESGYEQISGNFVSLNK